MPSEADYSVRGGVCRTSDQTCTEQANKTQLGGGFELALMVRMPSLDTDDHAELNHV